MTRDYILLCKKAELLAKLFEYELIITCGRFSFYNSPDFKPFTIEVDPMTFETTSVEWFIYHKFEGRLHK